MWLSDLLPMGEWFTIIEWFAGTCIKQVNIFLIHLVPAKNPYIKSTIF
jgi:hypothetical protein